MWATTVDLLPADPMMNKMAYLYYTESYSAILYYGRQRIERFVLVSEELYFQGSGGVVAHALSMAEVKEELQRIHDLPDSVMISVCIGACIGRSITVLRWPKLLAHKEVMRGARNPSMSGNLYLFMSSVFGDNLYSFLSASFIAFETY